jgi:hypothetical protein
MEGVERSLYDDMAGFVSCGGAAVVEHDEDPVHRVPLTAPER